MSRITSRRLRWLTVVAIAACAPDGPTSSERAFQPSKWIGSPNAAINSTPCPSSAPVGFATVFCFNFTSIPGVWHGFIVGSSIAPTPPALDGQLRDEYVLVSPTGLTRIPANTPPDVNQAQYTFESEFNGTTWSDVLRFVTPAGQPAQQLTIFVVKRVIANTPCPPTVPPGYTTVFCFNFTSIPGVWHGFLVGNSIAPVAPSTVGELSAEYVLASPRGLTPIPPGSVVDVTQGQYTFESEFNGTAWFDVLRFVTSANAAPQQLTLAVLKRALTPALQVQSITALISQLVVQGPVNGGQAIALSSQLQTAIANLNSGKTAPAVNALQAFVNHVSALMSGSNPVLSAAEGQQLIDEANAVIARVTP